jgi:hypothetical protein
MKLSFKWFETTPSPLWWRLVLVRGVTGEWDDDGDGGGVVVPPSSSEGTEQRVRDATELIGRRDT